MTNEVLVVITLQVPKAGDFSQRITISTFQEEKEPYGRKQTQEIKSVSRFFMFSPRMCKASSTKEKKISYIQLSR